jgi:hypothetical protein
MSTQADGGGVGGSNDALTEAFEAQVKILREKMLFALTIYPALSPSMMHVAVGTNSPKSIWKDEILETLIEEGLIIRREVKLTTPRERNQTFTVLHLAGIEYNPPACDQEDQNLSDAS